MNSQLSARALRDQLIDRLRYEILSGKYKEGEILRQHEVGERFGVSRTPVREALIQLRNEGLVESDGTSGARIARQATEATRGFLNPLRCALEIHALRTCFDRLNAADFKFLDELVERMKAPCTAKDYVTLAELDLAFHRFLVEKSEQSTLLAIWSLIVGSIRSSFRELYVMFDDLADIYREHRDIVHALRTYDREAAIAFYATKIGQLPTGHDADAPNGSETANRNRNGHSIPFRDARSILQEFLR